MYWRDIGYLCKPNKKLDAMRRPTKAGYDRRQVYCNGNGVKRTEFYQAATAGIKPEKTVEIKESEYQREEYFEFDGVMYRIVRTYPVRGENLELVLTTLVQENV